jgi:hypothetical protein
MLLNVSGTYQNTLHCFGCGASLDIFGAARILGRIGDGDREFPKVIAEVINALGIIENGSYRRDGERNAV